MCKVFALCVNVCYDVYIKFMSLTKENSDMTTKLDFNRNSYNVVVRSELVSPYLTNVEMVVRPINSHKLDIVAISNLNKTLIIKKLNAEVAYESVPVKGIQYERLIIKYVGNVLPEDIVNLEEVIKMQNCIM